MHQRLVVGAVAATREPSLHRVMPRPASPCARGRMAFAAVVLVDPREKSIVQPKRVLLQRCATRHAAAVEFLASKRLVIDRVRALFVVQHVAGGTATASSPATSRTLLEVRCPPNRVAVVLVALTSAAGIRTLFLQVIHRGLRAEATRAAAHGAAPQPELVEYLASLVRDARERLVLCACALSMSDDSDCAGGHAVAPADIAHAVAR